MKFTDYKKIYLPDSPGVYLFKKNNNILYIGKATSLRNRVRSYFTDDLVWKRSAMIADMVSIAKKIDFIKSDSVLEALLLESNLIKKYQPKYNTLDKDDRSYNYVVITKENFPRVLLIRGHQLYDEKHSLIPQEYKISKIYGPFVDGGALKEALRIIRKILPFIDNISEKKTNYEFYRQIELAPDTSSAEAKKEYAKTIQNIKLFFEGKKKSILKNLKKEMKNFAKKHEFERADQIKKMIFSLGHIQDIALIKKENLHDESSRPKTIRIEAYDIAHISGTSTVGVMVVISNGKPDKNQYRKFRIRLNAQNDIAGLEEVLKEDLIIRNGNFQM